MSHAPGVNVEQDRHALPAEQAVAAVASDAAAGLSEEEAARRLDQFGPNTLPEAKPRSLLVVSCASSQAPSSTSCCSRRRWPSRSATAATPRSFSWSSFSTPSWARSREAGRKGASALCASSRTPRRGSFGAAMNGTWMHRSSFPATSPRHKSPQSRYASSSLQACWGIRTATAPSSIAPHRVSRLSRTTSYSAVVSGR